MNRKNVILVVAAHPDDEILGCGGAIAKHIKNGDQVHVMIMAEGLTSRDQNWDAQLRNDELIELHHSSKAAAESLNITSLILEQYPDNRMDSIGLLDVVKSVERIIEKYRPNVIYTHHSGDVNIDHLITHKAVVTACRPIPEQFVTTLLFFETMSSTEWQPACSGASFAPNWFVDITDNFEKKMEALYCYESEMRDWPHARSYKSIEILAKHRGATIGVDYAEAFMLGRKIEKKWK